jgi:hypothetical protein
LVQISELTICERQKEDKPFAETLLRIRDGSQTIADMKLLNTRRLDVLGISPDDPMILSIIHIYPTNKLVI